MSRLALPLVSSVSTLIALWACGQATVPVRNSTTDATLPTDTTTAPSPRGDAAGTHDAAADAAAPDDASIDAAPEVLGPCGRRWSTAPAIVREAMPARLFALSDVHGDLAALQRLLAAGGVVAGVISAPHEVQWNAGDARLVIVGDLIDKGPDSLGVLRYVRALGAAAASAGGRVVVTLGNHEAEFLADPYNDKASRADGITHEMIAAGLAVDAAAAGDDELGRFLCDLPMAAQIGPWFFAHAGASRGLTLDALEAELEQGVRSQGFASPALLGDEGILEARLESSPPQWWDQSGDANALLQSWTGALGVSHLVIGHRPGKVTLASGEVRAKDRMTALFGGLVVLIDTGMSEGVDDTGGRLLRIDRTDGGERGTVIDPNGVEVPL